MAPLYFWPQVLLNSQYNNCCCNHNGNCHCMTVKRIIWVKQKSRSHSKKKTKFENTNKNYKYPLCRRSFAAKCKDNNTHANILKPKRRANNKNRCKLQAQLPQKTKRRVECKASKCERTQHWKNIQMIHKCKDITACWNVCRFVSMCGVQLLSSLSSYSSLPTATTHSNSGMSKRH